MRYTWVNKAGLLDPNRMWYSPAIKIDYNMHTLEYINVTQTMSTGIEIIRNDIYIKPKLIYSEISNNLGNGMSIRSPFFDLAFCNIHDNFRFGFEYNPHYTTYEALQLRAGITDSLVLGPLLAQSGYDLANEGYRFITSTLDANALPATHDIEIRVSRDYHVMVDILDWNPDETQEKATVFDSAKHNIRPSTMNWKIEEDLVEFPVVSTSTAMTIRWQVRGPTSGRTTFLIRSRKSAPYYLHDNIPQKC